MEDKKNKKVMRKFTKFLKKHKALGKFKGNLWELNPVARDYHEYNSKNEFYLKDLRFNCENIPHKEIIAVSFVFRKTKEGRDYWLKLSNKWKEYCETKLGDKDGK